MAVVLPILLAAIAHIAPPAEAAGADASLTHIKRLDCTFLVSYITVKNIDRW
jgi:hypothetical protein